MVGHQQVLYRYAVFSGFLHAGSKHITAQHVLAHQAVIFGSFAALRVPGFLQALANDNAQRFDSCLAPSSSSLAKGCSLRLLMICSTPQSVSPSSTGTTSICLVR